MSILVLKKPLFSQIWGHFLVNKSEKSKFLAWIHMEYFHVGIFMIPRVCLIRKCWSQITAFFSVFQWISGYRAQLLIWTFKIALDRSELSVRSRWICSFVPKNTYILDFGNQFYFISWFLNCLSSKQDAKWHPILSLCALWALLRQLIEIWFTKTWQTHLAWLEEVAWWFLSQKLVCM